jgi:hypothetical protein
MPSAPTQLAPFTITATPGTNADGSRSATVTTGNGTTYVANGVDLTHATLALARRLVEEGYDPTTALVANGVTLADLSMAI